MIGLSLHHQIGAIAAWKLAIQPLKILQTDVAGERRTTAAPIGTGHSFSSADYRGSVSATLAGGLSSGNYTIVVEDVSEEDFRSLAEAGAGNDPLKPLQAHLFLHWIDAPRPAIGESGLVAVLRVTALRRRAGKWRYEMVVEGREWVYDRLLLPCPSVIGDGALDAAVKLARAMGVDAECDRPPAPVVNPVKHSSKITLNGVEQMRDFERLMVEAAAKTASPRAGLGMYLIRDGKLQIGPNRIKPVDEAVLPMLDAESGLLALDRSGAIHEDRTPVGIDDNPAIAHRDCFVATLRGRPDLKPGAIVKFEPPERSAFGEQLGFALGPLPQLTAGTQIAYVEEVNHRLSREQGFITTIHCVAASSEGVNLVERLWFDGSEPDKASEGGSGESVLTRIFDRVRDAARADRLPDVAQVRAHHIPPGAPETPALTEKLWRGLEKEDGDPYAAGRLPFDQNRRQELTAAPYATPFAYGPWGLVLPRYPGMRVLVVNRAGNPNDPVDVGALWSRGSGPSAAQMGDWWLCLPVNFDETGPPVAVGDRDAAVPPENGSAVNDLIDAHGNRVIELCKLTIRIGKSLLLSPSNRPLVEDAAVSIVYDNGTAQAKIQIAEDGSITIASPKSLNLHAAEGITLDSDAGVTIKAGGQVKVEKK
jgi:hypothetical protein